MNIQNQESSDQEIKNQQTKLQLEIAKCKKNLEQKKNLRDTLHKMKNTDEWVLCGLHNHHYLHTNKQKYAEFEEDKCNLEESCENAKLAIAQLLTEEKELLNHLKQLETKLGHLFGEEQEENEHDCNYAHNKDQTKHDCGYVH